MPNDANSSVVKASPVKEKKRPNTGHFAGLGLLLGTALAAYNLVQSSSLPGPALAVLGCVAVTLDMAAVELPLLGYFSAAPTCLGALALGQQGRTVLLISLLGLLLRTLLLSGKGWQQASWEAGGRALFVQTLLWTHNPWGLLPAAILFELWGQAGARLQLENERERFRWRRFSRLTRQHQLAALCLVPLLSLLSGLNPLYSLLAIPLLGSLHRAVESESLQLQQIDEKELQREKERAQQQLSQVSDRLERTQERLQLVGVTESAFWELGPVLFHCRRTVETAEHSLSYLLSRVPCERAAFLVYRDSSLQALATFPADGGFLKPLPGLLEESWQKQSPRCSGHELALPLGRLGMLYCSRSNPFRDVEVHLLRHLSGLFALGLQSVTLLQDQQHMLAGLAQSSKVAAVGQLAAGMAHELNSPLAAVELQLGLIRQRMERPEQLLASLDSAHRSLNRARELLQKLLFYSRDGAMPRHDVAIHRVVEDTVGFLRQTLATDGVEVACQLEGLAPFSGNAHELQQAISSLLLNARDACAGEGRVEVFTRMVGTRRQIRIVDNGHGIAPEIAGRIFEPFFTTRPVGALGLGLSLAQQIVEQHGGLLKGRNRVDGPGAEFLIEL